MIDRRTEVVPLRASCRSELRRTQRRKPHISTGKGSACRQDGCYMNVSLPKFQKSPAETLICTKNLVSIVIPAYNAAGCIGKCLESCNTQTYDRLEVIVVENGSTDATFDILSNFKCRWPIQIVRLSPNRGVTGGMNAGIKAANGEFVLLLNADVELDDDFVTAGLMPF